MWNRIHTCFKNSQNYARFFHSHSNTYLAKQLSDLLQRGKQGKIVALKKGHPLMGANINNDHCLRSVAVYEPETLACLSSKELETLQAKCKQNFSGFGHFKLIQDLSCVQVTTDSGHPFYYINPFKLDLDMSSLCTLEEAIENARLFSQSQSSNLNHIWANKVIGI